MKEIKTACSPILSSPSSIEKYVTGVPSKNSIKPSDNGKLKMVDYALVSIILLSG